MTDDRIKVYGYRWVVLAVFFIINLLMQLHWITFAPITSAAVEFYGVTEFWIGMLSMIFMIVYLIMSIPASYIVDRFGIHIGVGVGAVLTGIFGLVKGFYAESYTMVLIAQIGLSVAQPFILNSVTAVAARWFPIQERATAAGIAVLAQLLGITVAMALTPYLYINHGMKGMLMIYAVATVVGVAVFLIFAREKPPTSPDPEGTMERHSVFEGLKHIMTVKDMLILIVVFFIALGMFNAVTTWIEQILKPRGFDITQAGMAGAVMLVGGILGAVIVPALSDKKRKRKPFILYALLLTIPGLVGITFAASYWLLLVSCFFFGFFFMAAGPIGYQYGSEITFPAPEATSQGLLVLAGQISGIIFIIGMDILRTEDGSMTPFMLIFIGLMLINAVLCMLIKESKMIEKE
ncbi:MAG: MFS transporter [Deltaproteobacteria bacterium]|nr:MFS transporter [Candidatus Zymogenaceae bacterium]